MAGNTTRINCLKGSYAQHANTIALTQLAVKGRLHCVRFLARKRRWIRFSVRDCADFYQVDVAAQSRTRKQTQKRTQKP
jgi:hypothetical protein